MKIIRNLIFSKFSISSTFSIFWLKNATPKLMRTSHRRSNEYFSHLSHKKLCRFVCSNQIWIFKLLLIWGDSTLKVQICRVVEILQLAPVCTRITLRADKNYALRVTRGAEANFSDATYLYAYGFGRYFWKASIRSNFDLNTSIYITFCSQCGKNSHLNAYSLWSWVSVEHFCVKKLKKLTKVTNLKKSNFWWFW